MTDADSGKERPSFQPLAYHDKELEGMTGHRVLNDHMGLHDVLGVLTDAVAKRGKDYNLCHEVRYTLTAGPITLAKGISRFLVWWNEQELATSAPSIDIARFRKASTAESSARGPSSIYQS